MDGRCKGIIILTNCTWLCTYMPPSISTKTTRLFSIYVWVPHACKSMTMTTIVFVSPLYYISRNWCKARRRSVKRRLRNSATNSAASRLQKFTSSLSLRSHGKRHVTMTTVSFDDVEVEDEYEFVEPAATSITQVDNN